MQMQTKKIVFNMNGIGNPHILPIFIYRPLQEEDEEEGDCEADAKENEGTASTLVQAMGTLYCQIWCGPSGLTGALKGMNSEDPRIS